MKTHTPTHPKPREGAAAASDYTDRLGRERVTRAACSLTEVQTIRRLLVRGYSHRRAAAFVGVNRGVVSRISAGHSYWWLPDFEADEMKRWEGKYDGHDGI